jgi:hypothetical protein
MSETRKARWLVIYGVCISLLTVFILPLLPERFPSFVIPLFHAGMASFVATKWQPSSIQIEKSARFRRHSTWRAAGFGILGLAVFAAIVFGFLLMFSALGSW